MAFQELLAGRSPVDVGRTARGVLVEQPENTAARLLAAQASWVGGSSEEALEFLVAGAAPDPGSLLLLARLEELQGNVVDAYAGYRDLATRFPIAEERRSELRSPALQTVANRLFEDLEGNRIEAARAEMALLDEWAADDPITLEARWRLAAATGDLQGELAALRVLDLLPGRSLEVAERRATLEVEIGDAQEGLSLLEELAAADPSDPSRAESLARARFRYRLRLLPEEVLGLARQAELERADFATLLYWLVPGVRQASEGSARIATDILDLERGRRGEVARVVNRGLMDVDSVTHRFHPHRPLSSEEASQSLLTLLTKLETPPACVRQYAVSSSPSSDGICRTAEACGLVLRDSACLPTAPVSGADALERIRRALGGGTRRAMSDFVHLHLHSQYSLLDGANKIGDLMTAAGEKGMTAMALTDHGNMFGAVEFYDQARASGIKPILGIEAYMAQGDRADRNPQRAHSNHLVLLAKNRVGYANLLKLTTRSFLEGFYYKPRIDKTLLREHSEGLICLSACLNGEVNQNILEGREAEAEAIAKDYQDMFGEGNFFMELQDHGMKEQRDANEVVRRIARRNGFPLVVTNDCHYLRHDDHIAHDVLLCIGTQKNVSDVNRLRYPSDQFFLKDADEMLKVFPKDREAIENTVRIAEMCDVEIPSGQFHLPEFPVPADYTLDTYLAEVAREGLDRRLHGLERTRPEALRRNSAAVYRKRLEEEIQIIIRMGFAGYFLIVWDFMRYAREEDIPVGPGRGSAAGSLVSYSLRITDIDPLQYDLLFERFLNPERISMPDIDIDFCMRRRGEVIQFVSEKYGRDRVAQIITFGTLGAKAVLRDVGRVMGVPYAKIDRVAKLVPDMTKSLSEAAGEIDALKREVAQDQEVRRVVEIGQRLEGLTRHASVHAAGVVIAPCAIEELVPLYKTSKDEVVTQWDKDVVEGLGLLKMDFLGLRTLTVIDDAMKSIRHQGIELDLDEIPLDDPAVFRLFCEGRTNGIFQFESRGMKDLLVRGLPSKFEDLAAFNALYRPGALSVGMVDEYVKRKKGERRISYIIPETEQILSETYGVIAYQEQVMQLAVLVAGFTMGEADVLRKAMGKKKLEVMTEQKQKFADGAVTQGFDRKKALELWEYIEPFAGYGFNKSHSVAYAMLAYKTAYLKVHHPESFMAAMLTSEMGTSENVAKYVRECRKMGIEVLPPDVNESGWRFTTDGDSIRFGLGAVKGIGENAIESMLEVRRRVGRFSGLHHLCCEADLRQLNKKGIECLIKAGCFDSIVSNRRVLFEALESIMARAQRRRRERDAGQSSLFGEAAVMAPEVSEEGPDWPPRERLQFERESLGIFLTGNPLEDFREVLARKTRAMDRLDDCEGTQVCLGGLVTRSRQNKIKSGPNSGRFMGRFVLEGLEGTVAVALFADQFDKYRRLVQEDAIVLVTGQVRERGGAFELRAEKIEAVDQESYREFEIEMDLGEQASMGKMLELRNLIVEHPGRARVIFRMKLPTGEKVSVAAGEEFRASPDAHLLGAAEKLLGAGKVFARELRPERAVVEETA